MVIIIIIIIITVLIIINSESLEEHFWESLSNGTPSPVEVIRAPDCTSNQLSNPTGVTPKTSQSIFHVWRDPLWRTHENGRWRTTLAARLN